MDQKFLARFAATCMVLVISACGGSDQSATEGDTSSESGFIQIKGSDTMVHLVTAWAEAFGDANPSVEVAVTGGGSGTGIAALINGTTEIAASSRDIQQKEIDQAQAQGVTPVENAVALDGIAIVVNPSNPVSELTLNQIKQIYTGAVTNWSQVGGEDKAIDVISRESSSGTFVFFQEHVLAKEDFAPSTRLMPATSGITQEVASNAAAIGYIGLGYLNSEVKMISVKADDASPAVLPSEASVRSGEYSVARPLFLYTAGEPTGSVKAFLDFVMSPQGQEIVRETGYVSAQ